MPRMMRQGFPVVDATGESLGLRFDLPFPPCVFDDFARLQAGRADADPFWRAVDKDPDTLEVGIPPPSGEIVGVGDLVSGDRFFAAYFTNFGHLIVISWQRLGVQFMPHCAKGKRFLDNPVWCALLRPDR